MKLRSELDRVDAGEVAMELAKGAIDAVAVAANVSEAFLFAREDQRGKEPPKQRRETHPCHTPATRSPPRCSFQLTSSPRPHTDPAAIIIDLRIGQFPSSVTSAPFSLNSPNLLLSGPCRSTSLMTGGERLSIKTPVSGASLL